MDFTISTFTEYGPHCANFDQLLAQAIRSKSGLEIDFEACAIRIAPNAEESTMLFAAPQLDLDACSRSRGASALLPFLETASSVSLSHTDLYFLRLHRRTIADCLARNLFNAFACSDQFSLVPTFSVPSSGSKKLSGELAKRYLWYLRSIFDEPLLTSPHALDKIFMGSYLPSVHFATPFLERGLESVRQIRECSDYEPPMSRAKSSQIAEFDACRTELLSVLG